ncbi:hypothetical protein [Cryobacterium arcticum]|uniref:Uncharacterized protein n=1 Tax=Cryobacterium arcticum TaxID=670052 RepID=A0A1B1BPG7_9MICO|nr:hypothetical protein [Cryobacterium arcticum]ANP74542.1 hypothetical protein PA27867_3624 [Cryobacterium arcticum]
MKRSTIQQAPSNSDNTMKFSLEYAHEWWMRFGESCPISGDAIARRNGTMLGSSFWAGVEA